MSESRHGRDGRLHVWQLREDDEADLSSVLPIDDAVTERKQPWLLHTLTVSAINFCAFASLSPKTPSSSSAGGEDELLIATPGVQDGSVNITALPGEERVATVPPPKGMSTGMLMAIGLYHDEQKDGRTALTVVGGYESGHAAVLQQNATGHWTCLYQHKAHSQPVLSLAILPGAPLGEQEKNPGSFFTSSADAIIARHPLPAPGNPTPDASEGAAVQTKHAGQQSLVLRSDNLIFATAGWDGRVRVYSAKTMKELAVLKWHKEGCYAAAFAAVDAGVASGDVSAHGDDSEAVVKREPTVAEKRAEKTKTTHWLAAGSKDGKVSLWEVY